MPTYNSCDRETLLTEFEQKWKARKTHASHVCEHCGNAFTLAASLRRHKATACKAPEASERSEASGTPERPEASSGTPERPKGPEGPDDQSPHGPETRETIETASPNLPVQTATPLINAFGSESLDHVAPAFLDQCIRRTDKGIVELLEKIHFDSDEPGNCNIRATNAKLPFVKYHDGVRWKLERKAKLLDELVERARGMMQSYFDGHSSEYNEHVCVFLNKMQLKDKKTWRDVLSDVYVLMLNASS